MYKSYINTGVLHEVFPSFENCDLKNEMQSGEVYNRISLDGEIIFHGKDYDFINTLSKRFIDFILENVLTGDRYYFKIDRNGRYNTILKLCYLKTIYNDRYSELLKNKEKEVNILQLADFYTINTILKYDFLEFKVGKFTENNQLGSKWWAVPGYIIEIVEIYARQRKTVAQSIVNIYVNNGWEVLNGTTNVVIKDWVGDYNELYLDPENPENADITVIWENEDPINTQIMPYFTAIYPTPTLGKLGMFVLDNRRYYGEANIQTTRWLDFRDAIMYMLTTQIDVEITSDSESFKYFDENEDLQYLFIASITDLILVEGSEGFKVEKSNPATLGNITLTRLLQLLRDKFNIFLRLTEDKIVRFVHYTEAFERSAADSYNDINDILGYNFTIENYEFSYNEANNYNRLKRNEVGRGVDFLGTDILFPDIESEDAKELNYTGFYFDINDILINGNRYPESATNEFAIVSAEKIDGEVANIWVNLSYNKLDGEDLAVNERFSGVNFTNLQITTNTTARVKTLLFKAAKGEKLIISGSITGLPANSRILVYEGDFGTVNFLLVGNYAVTGVLNISHTFIKSSQYTVVIQTVSACTISLSGGSFELDRQYVVRNETGSLSGETDIPNVELSIANMDFKHIAQLPDKVVTINNQTFETETERLSPQIELKYTVCLPDINAIDLEKYVQTDFGNDYKVKSLSKKIDDNIYELTLEK
jgi:hypothetical protein